MSYRLAFLGLFLPLLALPCTSQIKGHLFIIGGGDRSPEMMREFVALAGGPGVARIAVFPNASSEPETSGRDMVEEFRRLGVRSATMVWCTRAQASASSAGARLDSTTGAYFCGGDQARVTRDLLHTPMHDGLWRLYTRGGVLGGTSAGAAIMSKVMITGDEKINKDSNSSFPMIKRGNVDRIEGMGFMTTVVIDQHFVKRKRHNRLLSLVLEYPSLVGVGIDEATAIIVRPDSTFTVTGDGSVVIYDPRQAGHIHTDSRGNLAGGSMRTWILVAGDTFDMRSGTPTAAGGFK